MDADKMQIYIAEFPSEMKHDCKDILRGIMSNLQDVFKFLSHKNFRQSKFNHPGHNVL